MHPKQAALLEQNRILSFKVSAEDTSKPGPLLLWKYTDEEGAVFYLKEKKTTVKSPYTGNSFSAKPTKFTPSAVGKDMKEDAKKEDKSGPVLLWKYEDAEGHVFYLDEKKTTIKSPYSGKSFSAKPEKLSPSAIGKDMKEEAKTASMWKVDASMWKVDASVEKTAGLRSEAVIFNKMIGSGRIEIGAAQQIRSSDVVTEFRNSLDVDPKQEYEYSLTGENFKLRFGDSYEVKGKLSIEVESVGTTMVLNPRLTYQVYAPRG